MDEGKKYLGESGFKSGLSSFFQGIKTLLAKKQDKLTAGDNITITNNKISSKNSVYTAGTNIEVSSDNKISAKVSADTFTGTLPVAKGGTGVTTQDKINRAFVAQLPVDNSDVTDGTEFVSSYASNNGFSDTNALNAPHRRKFSSVWNYIKGKISSVLGLTKDSYGGRIIKGGASSSWFRGRDVALVRNTAAAVNDGWAATISIKTKSGSVEIGNLYNENIIRIGYVADSDYNQNRNAYVPLCSIDAENKRFETEVTMNIPTSAPSSPVNGDIWIE